MKIRTLATTAIAFLTVANMERFMAHAQTQAPAKAPIQTQQAQTQAPSASPNVALPNGATSLNETYQDWVVLCSAGEKGRACVMTQQQRKQDTNQLVLAAEFTQVTKDEVRGSLVLPFGLRLADGVTLQIDDGPVSKPLPFTTCLPAGCIVQVAFDTMTVRALRSGSTAKLVARATDGGQSVQLGLSLKGFAAAQDRVLALVTQ